MDDRAGADCEILLVEDNPEDVRLVEEALQDTPGTLHITRDGKDALDFLQQRNGFSDAPRPDIVLLDLNLPKVDGTRVLDELRSTSHLDHSRVIIITSAQEQDTDLPLEESEVDAFIMKPVDPDEFISRVQTAIYD